jgi:uncharacterized delta-60 repeat protein
MSSLREKSFHVLMVGLLVLCLGHAATFGARPTFMDTTFQPDLSAFGNDTFPIFAIESQPDGKLLLAGGDKLPVVSRLNRDGTLDRTFQLDSKFGVADATADSAAIYSVMPQPDGYILAWEVDNANRGELLSQKIARLRADGSLDPAFAAVFLSSTFQDFIHSFEVLPDGRIFLTGSFNSVNREARAGVAILKANGALDPAFASLQIDPTVTSAAFAPANDGKLFVARTYDPNRPHKEPLVSRVNIDGSLDTTFILKPGALPSLTRVSALVAQADGTLLLAGNNYADAGGYRVILTRLLADGSADSTFAPCREARAIDIYSVKLRGPDLLVVGSTLRGQPVSRRLLILNEDGSLQQNLTAGLDLVSAILEDPVHLTADGKIVTRAFIGYLSTAYPPPLLGRFFTDFSRPGLEFDQPTFSTDETNPMPKIKLRRTGDISLPMSALFAATGASTNDFRAIEGKDFLAQRLRINFLAGQETADVIVPIIDNSRVDGDRTVALQLSDPSAGVLLGPLSTATLTIIDNEILPANGNSAEGLRFLDVIDEIDESSLQAQVTVLRTGSSDNTISLDYQTIPQSAKAGVDFEPVSGQLTFAPFETTKTITIPLHNSPQLDPEEDFRLSLIHVPADVNLETGATAQIHIHDDDTPGAIDFSFNPHPRLNGGTKGTGRFAVQPDGKLLVTGVLDSAREEEGTSIERLNEDGSVDDTFQVMVPYSCSWGCWTPIDGLLAQKDNKVIIAGEFARVDGVLRESVARLQPDGALDEQFDAGEIDGTVNTLAEQEDRKLIIGGTFTRVNGIRQPGLARLYSNGALDQTFHSPFAAGTGVRAIILQNGGKLFVGGDLINGANGIGAVLLLADGTIDPKFSAAVGSVMQLIQQTDGKLLAFTGSDLVRLNANGALDSSFQVRSGAEIGSSIALQSDGKIVVALRSNSANGTMSQVIRLNPNGSLDSTFQATELELWQPADIAILPDNRILVSGNFESFGGFPRAGIVRLHNDPLLTLRSIQKAASATLTLTAPPGRPYVLERSFDLSQWQAIVTNRASTFSLDFLDTDTPKGRAFYRAVQPR